MNHGIPPDSFRVCNATDRGKWTFDPGALIQVGVACALVAASFALSRLDFQEAQWPITQGTIRSTRIVADHAVQTKWGGQIAWRADYAVAFAVASRRYSVWVDSGLRGETEADVQISLTKARPTFEVRYNPKKPEVSVVHCK